MYTLKSSVQKSKSSHAVLKASYILTIILFCAMSGGRAQDLLAELPADSTNNSPSDSTKYYRPTKPEKQKSINIRMTEYMVKSNLARLSYYAQGRYLSSYSALDEMFLQANLFPESIKNRMFAYAVAGGVAREVFRQTRKQLAKRKLGFIYPNLYGVNLIYPLRSIKGHLHFRTMTLDDRYYGLSLARSKVYLMYRETAVFNQQACYLKVYQNIRLFALRSNYAKSSYNGIGLSHFSKKLFIYFIFLQNPQQSRYNRATLFVNLNLN